PPVTDLQPIPAAASRRLRRAPQQRQAPGRTQRKRKRVPSASAAARACWEGDAPLDDAAGGGAGAAPIRMVESRNRIASAPPPGNERFPTCRAGAYGRITQRGPNLSIVVRAS